MWRTQSTHEQSETEYLDQMIERIDVDQSLYKHAQAVLHGAAAQEPLLADALKTPQDTRSHAEGPFMDAHLRRMLMVLFGVVAEKIHLIDIEEFRRLKGYEGEVDELEELLKEKFAFFKSFILAHDASKWVTMTFETVDESRGHALGFNMHLSGDPIVDHEHRIRLRDRYHELFEQFASQYPTQSDREIQCHFFDTYQIRIDYPHHGRMIHAPVFEDLLHRICEANELSARDVSMLEDIISHHMEFAGFEKADGRLIGRFIHLAQKRGYDGDDFIDLLQGCIFLDWVVGSSHMSRHGVWHNSEYFVNSLKSEHQFAPRRRVEQERARAEQKGKRQNRLFREVGLDGSGLIDLLGIQPGPKLGKTLKQIQHAVTGETKMPSFSKKIDQELQHRSTEFYKKMFVKGE